MRKETETERDGDEIEGSFFASFPACLVLTFFEWEETTELYYYTRTTEEELLFSICYFGATGDSGLRLALRFE